MPRIRSEAENTFIFTVTILVHILVMVLLAIGLVVGIVESYTAVSIVKVVLTLVCFISIHLTGHNVRVEFKQWKYRKTNLHFYSEQFAGDFKIFFTRNRPVTVIGKVIFILTVLLVVVLLIGLSGHSVLEIPTMLRKIK